MAGIALGTKAVGSTVKLNVDGVARDFLVVHQGLPGSLYDSSCDGTWLLMKDVYENRQWHSSNSNSYGSNNYKASTIHAYLNNEWLKKLDADIQAQVKQVKIPYVNGTGNSVVVSGANGLPCKVFLLSAYEVGWTQSTNQYFPIDGAKLSYFDAGTGTAANNKRIAYLNGTATIWWLRSPYTNYSYRAWYVDINGKDKAPDCSGTYGIRPALVLPENLVVSDDGTVSTNTPPEITCGTTDLGTKSADFSVVYSVSDADGDSLTVTEKLDALTHRTFTAENGVENTFNVGGVAFQKLLNGPHTMSISVSDGKEETSHALIFTKSVTEAGITLAEPMAADGPIELCVLSVTGEIPEDANYKVEVTNNANDPTPLWEDCTNAVKSGLNHVFENKSAANGFAFSFWIAASRGESGQSGFITSVQGGFQ